VWAFAAVGGLLLVIAAMFGLREAIRAGWFGPTARFAAGVLLGTGSWLVAELLRWRKYTVPGAALTGAGTAILYATLYSGHARWGLLSQPVTFVAMVALTAVAMLAAYRRDSRFVAYLALAGGFSTPILLSTGENKAVAFFSYLFLLDAGLLWLARRRQWPELVAIAGVVTGVLYLGWAAQFRAPDQVVVGLVAAAVFAGAWLSLVRSSPPIIAGIGAAVGVGLYTAGLLAMGTPTDILRVDPVSAMPLPWDLGATAWYGAAYLILGAGALPLLLRRWTAAQVGAGLALGVGVLAHALSWSLAGEGRWDVVSVVVPVVSLVALLSGGLLAGLAPFVAGAVALVLANALHPVPADWLPVVTLGMLVGAMVGGYARGARPVLPAATVLLAALLYPSLHDRLLAGESAAIIGAALPVYLVAGFGPLLLPRRGDFWGVLGVALAPVVYFLPLMETWEQVLGPEALGLLPLLLGCHTLVGAVVLVRRAKAELLDKELAMLVAITLLSVAVAIPVQLDRQWITVGWAIEVALLGWVSRRVKHPLFVAAGAALAAAVGVRLLLNPFALEYGRGEGPILLNWTLYTWGIPTVALLVAARFYENPWMSRGLRTLAVLTGFALLNLEIAHAFAHDNQLSFRSELIGVEMTRSIAWGGYGLLLIVLGIGKQSRATRLAGLGFAVLGAAKVFLFDTWSLSGFARVGAYAGMAVTLIAAAVAFAYLARNEPKKTETE